jgi:hypothetical protein
MISRNNIPPLDKTRLSIQYVFKREYTVLCMGASRARTGWR